MKTQGLRADIGEAQTRLVALAEQRTRELLLRTDALLVSQGAVQTQVRSLSEETAAGLEMVETAMVGIGAAFDWRLAELVWLVEQGNETMQKVLDVLRAPLGTQARELRRRAEHAYSRGWMDEALADFLESEKANPYDFAVLFYIANIAYYHSNELAKAREYYEKVVKFASAESPIHAGMALLHIGRIERTGNDAVAAYGATKQALGICPELGEVHFEHGCYCALLGRDEEALGHVAAAIAVDRLYCARALAEEDLAAVRGKVVVLLEHVRDLLHQRGRDLTESADSLTDQINSLDTLGQTGENNRILLEAPGHRATPTKKTRRAVHPDLAKKALLELWDAISGFDGTLQELLAAWEEAQRRAELGVNEAAWAKAADAYAGRLAWQRAAAWALLLGGAAAGGVAYAMVRVGEHYGPGQFSNPWNCVAVALVTCLVFGFFGWAAASGGYSSGKSAGRRRFVESAGAAQLKRRREELAGVRRIVEGMRDVCRPKAWRDFVLAARSELHGRPRTDGSA